MDPDSGKIFEVPEDMFKEKNKEGTKIPDLLKKEGWMELPVNYLVQVGTCYFRIKSVSVMNQEVILRPIPKQEAGIK